MKAEILEIGLCKIGIAVVVVAANEVLEPISNFLLMYSPFYGILGVIGNVVSWAIYQMAAENKGEKVKKKSKIYHVATFLIAFIVPIMFTKIISQKFGTEEMLSAFLIGLCTSFMDELLGALKKVAIGSLKIKNDE